jgi:hypothetical protein
MLRIAVACVFTAVLVSTGAAQAQEPCWFAAGFATLHDQLPGIVGQCLENEQHNPATGDAEQHTTTGVLVWRKAAHATAFSDGFHTWISGPGVLAMRRNDQRFAWEPNPQGLPVVAEVVAAPDPPAREGALLPAQRIVAYYGNPRSAAMGVLGQLPPEQMLDRLGQQAQAYAVLDPQTPVHPALELVAVAAQQAPGADGLYRGRSSSEEIERVASWARSRGYLLILDVQPGRSTFAAEIAALAPFLAEPDVHLALDPEWAMGPGQVPGRTIGGTDAVTVNQIIQTVAGIVAEHNLPPKVLVIHRFLDRMLANPGEIDLDPRVQVVITMDGVGGPAAKISRYAQVVSSQPVQFAGFKVFYTRDINPLTPEQVLALTPVPRVVIYQ